MINKIKALLQDRAKLREIIMYLIFGVLTTAVSWVVYFVWRQLFGLGSMAPGSASYALIANSGQVLAFVLSVLFAFFTNRRYVFNSTATRENGFWRELWLFTAARILGWVVFDIAAFNLLVMLMKAIPSADLWVKLITNVLVVIFNYAASKWVVFKK